MAAETHTRPCVLDSPSATAVDSLLPSSPVVGSTTPPTPVTGAPIATSVVGFIDSLRMPLQEQLIQTPPRTRVSRVADDIWVPRRSVRLAAKSAYRDPQPEKQARRIILNRWRGDLRTWSATRRTTRSPPSSTKLLLSHCRPLEGRQCEYSSPCVVTAGRGQCPGWNERLSPPSQNYLHECQSSSGLEHTRLE
jgi:hypothetical protein